MLNKPNYRKVLFVPDFHAPYQDDKAINACVSFAKWWKPEWVIFLGDGVDFYAVSHFDRDPERKHKLQEEIDAAYKVLFKFRKALPKAQMHYIRGNHEDRLRKYIWRQAEELSGLRSLDVPILLGLKQLKITYHETGRMRFHSVLVKHGDVVRKFAGYTAKGEFESTLVNGISGHTHRLAIYSQSTEAGDFAWMESGCLCDLNPQYMEGKTPNWQHGFGIGFFKENSKRFHFDIVRIIDGRAMWSGYEFS